MQSKSIVHDAERLIAAAAASGDNDPIIVDKAQIYLDDLDFSWRGFYAGKVIAKSNTHIAIWSRLAKRVALVPLIGLAGLDDDPQVNDIIAAHSWNKRLRGYEKLTKTFDWLDAFDDFSCDLQRYFTLKSETERPTFVLDEHGRPNDRFTQTSLIEPTDNAMHVSHSKKKQPTTVERIVTLEPTQYAFENAARIEHCLECHVKSLPPLKHHDDCLFNGITY